jgi:hypothetical protein
MLGGGYGDPTPKGNTNTNTNTNGTKEGQAESPQAMPCNSLDSSFRWNDGEVVVRS